MVQNEIPLQFCNIEGLSLYVKVYTRSYDNLPPIQPVNLDNFTLSNTTGVGETRTGYLRCTFAYLEGNWNIEGRVYDVRTVRAYMEQFLINTPKGTVVIATDKDSSIGRVIQVMDQCKLAGVKNVSVAERIET